MGPTPRYEDAPGCRAHQEPEMTLVHVGARLIYGEVHAASVPRNLATWASRHLPRATLRILRSHPGEPGVIRQGLGRPHVPW